MLAVEFSKRAKDKDGKATCYLVGGAVRDEIMGKIPKDRDYCVCGLSKEEFEETFPEAILNGVKKTITLDGKEQVVEFPVYRLEIEGELCEVALGRRDYQFGPSHNDIIAIPDKTITIKEDLDRRDITINSIAKNLETGEYADPFFGRKHIQEKVIQKTSDAFRQDKVRIYRAARFAAELGFTVEEGTLEEMSKTRDTLHEEKIERVWGETKKALLSNHPSVFFRTLKKAEILGVHFPELDVLSDYEQSPEFHPEGDAFEHTMQVLDAARVFAQNMPLNEGELNENGQKTKERLDRELVVVLGALTHDFGKAVTQGVHKTKGTPTYINHEKEGVPLSEQFLERFHLEHMKTPVAYATANHMVIHHEMKDTKMVDFLEGKFEPRGLNAEEKEEAKKWLDSRGLNPKEHLNRMKIYEREPGIHQSIGLEELLAISSADVAGRMKNPENLPAVVDIFQKVFNAEGEKVELIADSLLGQFDSREEAISMKQDLLDLVERRNHLLQLSKKSKAIQSTLNVETLREFYKPYFVGTNKGGKLSFHDAANIDVGYKIHQSKRTLRIKLSQQIRDRQKNRSLNELLVE